MRALLRLAGSLFAHDKGDRITKITNGIDANLTQTFGYDALSRLTTVAAPIGNETIAYDANSNRTQYNWLANLTFAVEATSNRITGEQIAYGHDGRGNRSSQSWNGSTATYAYDAFNRLTSLSRTASSTYQNPGYQTMTYPAGTTSYTVNALGQRVGKSGPLGTSRFVYGGQTQLLAEHGGSWSSYLWLGGEAVGLVRGGQLYFLHGDHLARPEVVTNGAADTVWRARNLHSERGVITDAIGGLNLGFPGQYFDAESGLWYNGLRDGYDSRVGRYTQSDPIGLAGGLNTYTYVGGNPVSLIDPEGLRGSAVRNAPRPQSRYNNPNQLRLLLPYSPGPQLHFSYRGSFTQYRNSLHSRNYAESHKRDLWSAHLSILEMIWPASSYDTADKQCAVMVCGPGMSDGAQTCPAVDNEIKQSMVGPDGPSSGCYCL
jgi:RHS repeat-associated protein